MKPVDFTLHQPRTLDEAVALLGTYGDEAKLLAGGQSLVPLLNFRLARPEHVIDLDRIAALSTVTRTRDHLVIGAMVRYARAERSPAVAVDAPLVAAAIPLIAHQPVRARGTIGGSLAHADPAAELPAVAVALDATLVAAGTGGRREIRAADFFVGNLMTALRCDEVLVEVRIDRAPPGTGAAFEEVSRRRGDFALVGVAAQLTVAAGRVGDVRICLSGVAPVPYRAGRVEALILGQRLDDRLLDRAAQAIRDGIEPGGDLHATAAYRRDVAGVLVARALRAAHDRAGRAGHTAA